MGKPSTRRRFVGRVLLSTSALWACFAVGFVLSGGGDRQAVGLMVMIGVMCTAGQVSGEWERRDRAVQASDHLPPSSPWRRFAVIAVVTAAALAITVLAFTPRRDGDWWGATAAWSSGSPGWQSWMR